MTRREAGASSSSRPQVKRLRLARNRPVPSHGATRLGTSSLDAVNHNIDRFQPQVDPVSLATNVENGELADCNPNISQVSLPARLQTPRVLTTDSLHGNSNTDQHGSGIQLDISKEFLSNKKVQQGETLSTSVSDNSALLKCGSSSHDGEKSGLPGTGCNESNYEMVEPIQDVLRISDIQEPVLAKSVLTKLTNPESNGPHGEVSANKPIVSTHLSSELSRRGPWDGCESSVRLDDHPERQEDLLPELNGTGSYPESYSQISETEISPADLGAPEGNDRSPTHGYGVHGAMNQAPTITTDELDAPPKGTTILDDFENQSREISHQFSSQSRPSVSEVVEFAWSTGTSTILEEVATLRTQPVTVQEELQPLLGGRLAANSHVTGGLESSYTVQNSTGALNYVTTRGEVDLRGDPEIEIPLGGVFQSEPYEDAEERKSTVVFASEDGFFSAPGLQVDERDRAALLSSEGRLLTASSQQIIERTGVDLGAGDTVTGNVEPNGTTTVLLSEPNVHEQERISTPVVASEDVFFSAPSLQVEESVGELSLSSSSQRRLLTVSSQRMVERIGVAMESASDIAAGNFEANGTTRRHMQESSALEMPPHPEPESSNIALAHEDPLLVDDRSANNKLPEETAERSDLRSSQDQKANEGDALVCPICMEPWTNTGDHRICSLACGHLFGKSCIRRWLKQTGKKHGKCPHCNKRARLEDLRNIYVPHIAVTDGQSQQLAQEVNHLRSENTHLKMENARLMDEVNRAEVLIETVLVGRSDEFRRPERPLPEIHHLHNHHSLLKRQREDASAPSKQLSTAPGKHRHSKEDILSDSEVLPNARDMGVFAIHARQRLASSQFGIPSTRGGSTLVQYSRHFPNRKDEVVRIHRSISSGQAQSHSLRSSSSLACFGSSGLEDSFILQDEAHMQGAKVFDMDAYSQMVIVSNKTSSCGSTFGLTKMSLLATSEVENISLPSGFGAIRDIRFSPSGIGSPGKLALVASIGKKLSVVSLESNNIVLNYSVQSAPWSCAWDPSIPTQVYSGLQNGSLLIFDLRQTSSPIASWSGANIRPIHTLQAVAGQSRQEVVKRGGKGILSASSSGVYFWELGSSADMSETVRPYCISDFQREKLCVSLVYESFIKSAVASFRPSPLAHTDSSSCTPGSSEVDNSSQPLGATLEPSSTTRPTTQDSPSHCIFSETNMLSSLQSNEESHVSDTSITSGESTSGNRSLWRWEVGRAMVGHKSHSVMPRSAIIPERDLTTGFKPLFASGDEGSNSVWLWNMESLGVVQTLIPHQSPVLDVKYVQVGGRDVLGCVSERTFQLYRRLSSTL